jgi:hypothetical protein
VDEEVKLSGLPTVTGELLCAIAPVGGVQVVATGFTTTFTVNITVQVLVLGDATVTV